MNEDHKNGELDAAGTAGAVSANQETRPKNDSKPELELNLDVSYRALFDFRTRKS